MATGRWFDGEAKFALGGDSTGMATDRLWEVWEEERFRKVAQKTIEEQSKSARRSCLTVKAIASFRYAIRRQNPRAESAT